MKTYYRICYDLTTNYGVTIKAVWVPGTFNNKVTADSALAEAKKHMVSSLGTKSNIRMISWVE